MGDFYLRHCEEHPDRRFAPSEYRLRDEAIQYFLAVLDCFAEPPIGLAEGETRWLAMTLSTDHDPCLAINPGEKPEHVGFRHRYAAGGWRKSRTGKMKKDSAAAPGDARYCVVIDLDDEIVEMILTRQSVGAAGRVQPDRPVVVTIAGILAPAIVRANSPNGQSGRRPDVPVSSPPQPQRVKNASRCAAIAFSFVGENATTAEGDGEGLPAKRHPAALTVARSRANMDHC